MNAPTRFGDFFLWFGDATGGPTHHERFAVVVHRGEDIGVGDIADATVSRLLSGIFRQQIQLWPHVLLIASIGRPRASASSGASAASASVST